MRSLRYEEKDEPGPAKESISPKNKVGSKVLQQPLDPIKRGKAFNQDLKGEIQQQHESGDQLAPVLRSIYRKNSHSITPVAAPS